MTAVVTIVWSDGTTSRREAPTFDEITIAERPLPW